MRRIGLIGLIGLMLVGAAWGSDARVVGMVQPTSGGPMFRITTGTVLSLDGWYRGTLGLKEPRSCFWLDVNEDGVLSLTDDVAVTSTGLWVMGTLVVSGTSTFGDGSTTAVLTQLRFEGDGCTITLTDEGSGLGYLTIDVDATVDHGALGGLEDDDHPQYALDEDAKTSLALYLKLDGTNSPTGDISWGSQELEDVANLWVDDNIYMGFDNPSSNTSHRIYFNTIEGRQNLGWNATTHTFIISHDTQFFGGFKLAYNPDIDLGATGSGLEMFSEANGTAFLRGYDRTNSKYTGVRVVGSEIKFQPYGNDTVEVDWFGMRIPQGYGLGVGGSPSSYTTPIYFPVDIYQGSSSFQAFVYQSGDLWAANMYNGGGQDLGVSGFYASPSVRTGGSVNGTFSGFWSRPRHLVGAAVDDIAGVVAYSGQGNATSGASGSTDNAYGVKIRDWYANVPNTATNQYGLYIEQMQGFDTNYQIYSESGSWYSGGGDLTMAGGSVKAGANLYVNQDGPDGDSFVYFFDDSSDTDEYLKWDEADDRFELSDDLYVDGDIALSGEIVGYATDEDAKTTDAALRSDTETSLALYLALDGSNNPTATIGWNDFHLTDVGQLDTDSITTEGSLITLMIDSDNSDGGSKYFGIFTGDHPTNIGWHFGTDADVFVGGFHSDAGVDLLDIGGDGTSTRVGRAPAGARTHYYANGYIAAVLPSADGSDEFRVSDSSINELFSVDSNGDTEIWGASFFFAGNSSYINYDGADGDSFMYFYEDSSATGEWFKWDDTDDRFEISDDLYFPVGSGISSDVGSDTYNASPGHLYVAGVTGPNGSAGTAGTAALNGLPMTNSGSYAFAIPVRQVFVNSTTDLGVITIAGEFDASDYITSTAIWTWNPSGAEYEEIEEDSSNITSTSEVDRVSGTVVMDADLVYYFVVQYVASAGSKKLTELRFGWGH